MPISCYDCALQPVCSFHRDVEDAIRRNLNFIDVDQPSSSPKSFVHIHKAIAVACTKFKKI